MSDIVSATGSSMNRMARRLVTHNLIHEAACFETVDRLNWVSIRELSVFIDLFCLCDNIAALDWHLRSFPRDGSSDFFALVDDESFILSHDSRLEPRVRVAAEGHLGKFLDEAGDVDRCRRIIELCTDAKLVERVATFFPREQRELQTGLDWLRSDTRESDLQGALENDEAILTGAVFTVRTFLYASYAEIGRLPFTPDLTRTEILLPVIDSERNLRGRIQQVLQASFQAQPLGDDFGLTRRTTSLASIVFNRAVPNKRNIVREMVRLRKELAPLRARVRASEDRMLTGTAADEISARKKWEAAFAELERAFGAGQGHVILYPLTDLGPVADLIVRGQWVKAILALPLDRLSRVINRRPLIELHRLRTDMRSSEQVHRDIETLSSPV